jgi:hypothetical protein
VKPGVNDIRIGDNNPERVEPVWNWNYKFQKIKG